MRLCALPPPGMAWTRSPQSTRNLGLGLIWLQASTARWVSSTSSPHSSPPPSQSPSLQAFISPSWGSAAWMKKNGPFHSRSASEGEARTHSAETRMSKLDKTCLFTGRALCAHRPFQWRFTFTYRGKLTPIFKLLPNNQIILSVKFAIPSFSFYIRLN